MRRALYASLFVIALTRAVLAQDVAAGEQSGVLAFKVGGTAALPPLPPEEKLTLDPPPDSADRAAVAAGGRLFGRFCSVCHGEAAVGGGVIPDLHASPYLADDAWYEIVFHGALKDDGMVDFDAVLDRDKVDAIRAYLIHRANDDKVEAGK